MAAALNFGSRFIYSAFLPFEISVVLAYFTGMVLAFILFSTKVFKTSKSKISSQILKFTLVNILGAFQTLLISSLLVHTLFSQSSQLDEALAHIIAMSFVTVTSFYLHRYFTFKEQ